MQHVVNYVSLEWLSRGPLRAMCTAFGSPGKRSETAPINSAKPPPGKAYSYFVGGMLECQITFKVALKKVQHSVFNYIC
jgi:hypothetical protein